MEERPEHLLLLGLFAQMPHNRIGCFEFPKIADLENYIIFGWIYVCVRGD